MGSFLEARRAAEAAARALRITETKVKASLGEQKRSAQEEQRTAQERLRAADGPWRDTLGELCDWAWEAAIGPLLEAIPARGRGPPASCWCPPASLAWCRGTRRAAPSAAVPVRLPGGGLSYASSARQFISTAGRRPVRGRSVRC